MADTLDPTAGEPPADDPLIRAGEYALGVLEGGELASAQRALLADRGFAEAVEWWEQRFAAIAEQAGEYLPSAAVWRGIETRLDAESRTAAAEPVALPEDRASRRSLAALVTGGALAAAALALFLATPRPADVVPPDIAAAPSEQLIAQLQDAETDRRLASVVDVENRRLALTIAGLEAEPGQTPELWVIPAGGAPVSLGAIPESGRFQRDLSAAESALLVGGASLAVTFEEDSGTRHEAPTMPILLVGELDRV
ncbi:MAG: anti-sigma factor [Alphaproteobacteria bacterium]|nr:anti-sigma factor [Alphaproteobacteria bacterium]